MAFTKAYSKKFILTIEDANEIQVGGVTVAQEFIAWIEKFGQLCRNDVIVTQGGDLHASMPDLRYIFHINIHTVAWIKFPNLSECVIKLLEYAAALDLETVSIPLLISPKTLESSGRQYFTNLFEVIEQWVLYKIGQEECYMREIIICCPVATQVNMAKMMIHQRYKKQE